MLNLSCELWSQLIRACSRRSSSISVTKVKSRPTALILPDRLEYSGEVAWKSCSQALAERHHGNGVYLSLTGYLISGLRIT